MDSLRPGVELSADAIGDGDEDAGAVTDAAVEEDSGENQL
jgi:hypothetical protein